jgi:hypothetical protein
MIMADFFCRNLEVTKIFAIFAALGFVIDAPRFFLCLTKKLFYYHDKD